MGGLWQDTDNNVPLLQVSDFLAWGIRRELERIPCPILSTIRDTNRLAAYIESDARPPGYAQMAADIDEKARSIARREGKD
ncbi:MAG: hypothetical protein LAQ69_40875 [Acidobacteriia bacterium]|nr:hypothetical protein [Terriglobia bacterium]